MGVYEQYRRVRCEIDEACRACGRDPREVTLVSVSKTVEPVVVQEAIDAGCNDFGENRPDQLLEKHAVYPQARWHFIGNVQSRRIHDIVSCSTLVHSVYKAEHLPKFDAAAQELERSVALLLEINMSGEENKGGADPKVASDLLEEALSFPHIEVCGLMTMAAQGDSTAAEECFADLRLLRDSLNTSFSSRMQHPLTELSMGMSEDWRQAIAQGSTLVRIGRAVFSKDFA